MQYHAYLLNKLGSLSRTLLATPLPVFLEFFVHQVWCLWLLKGPKVNYEYFTPLQFIFCTTLKTFYPISGFSKMNFIEIFKNLCPRFTPFRFLLISYFIHVSTCNLIPCKKSDKCSCVIEDPKDHSHSTEFSLWPLNNNNGTPR